MDKKIRVLFYCKHNSCRSQMAEAYLKQLGQGRYEVLSAGLYPEPIHPMVYKVMEEDGVSLQSQTPKSVDMFLGKESFNNIIIVCQEGEAECPKLYPFAMKVERWSLSDPAEVAGEKASVLEAFRMTRNEIKANIQNWISSNH